MKKTILLPTDFSIESLNILKPILNNSCEDEKFDIILLQGVHFNDSITELLFFNKFKVISAHSSAEFDEACKILVNKYSSSINSIRKDIFTGTTQAAFNNYLEANKVDEVILPSSKSTASANKKCFDLKPFILKSKVPVVEFNVQSKMELPEKGQLAEIFYNSVSTN